MKNTWNTYPVNDGYTVFDSLGAEIGVFKYKRTANRITNYLNTHNIFGNDPSLDRVIKKITKPQDFKRWITAKS